MSHLRSLLASESRGQYRRAEGDDAKESRPGSVWGKWDVTALLAVTLLASAAAVVVHPTDDIPLMDDWTYAWSVLRFLRTGELRVLDWSIHYPLVQVAWGGLFAHAFGFSFFILRLSTLVLEWVGLLAFLFTLRAVGVGPIASVLGTLLLLFSPVVFVLAYSFMTDVPFLSVMNLASLCYVLWAKHRRPLYLCLGSVLTTAAYLIRQIAVALAIAAVVYLLVSRTSKQERRLPSWHEGLFVALPFLGIAFTQWWIRNVHGLTATYRGRLDAVLQQVLSISWWLSSESWRVYVLEGMVHVLVHLGFLLWPLALASLWRQPKRPLVLASAFVLVAVGVYVWHFGEIPSPLQYGGILSSDELGGSRVLISGADISRQVPRWTRWALLGFSVTSAIAIVAALLEVVRHGSDWLRRPDGFIAVNGFFQFVAIEFFWLYEDRYYLPLLPGVIALLLRGMEWTRGAKAITLAGLLVFSTVSVSGTVDNFRFNRAISDAREWLLSQGVVPWQIDAGYVQNGWWLYAHPANLPIGARPESDVPFVTSKTSLPYTIANSSLPSYRVLKVFTWRSLWAVSNRIYVLQRTHVAPSLTATLKSNPEGASLGTAEIRWSTGDGSIGRVYVSENGGEQRLFAQGAEGSRDARWIRPGAIYEFRLYPVSELSKPVAVVTLTPTKE